MDIMLNLWTQLFGQQFQIYSTSFSNVLFHQILQISPNFQQGICDTSQVREEVGGSRGVPETPGGQGAPGGLQTTEIDAYLTITMLILHNGFEVQITKCRELQRKMIDGSRERSVAPRMTP